MKYQPGFTDFFMSPVTGRIILPMFPDLYQNYVWIGNRNDRPLPSPIIIDLRLEIIDLRRRLSQTRFILQAASQNFDSSQALNELIPGMLRHDDGIVSIQHLTYNKIWVGNVDNYPEESDVLSGIEIEIGDINLTIDSILDHLFDIDVKLDILFEFKLEVEIQLGDINIELGDINIELGDINTSIESIIETISDITVDFGDIIIRLDALDGIVADLQTQIDTNVASGLDHLADLQLQIDTAIASGLDAEAAINLRLDALELAVTTINSTITTILSDISSIFSSLSTIASQITTILSDITTINTTLISLQTQIDTINTTITSILSDITTIYSDISTINSSITSILSSISTINSTLTSLQSQINTINTTITTIQSDITTLFSDITNITTVLLPAVYTYIDDAITNITNNFIAGGVIDMNDNRIINLPCDPEEDDDAISFCFLWHTLHDEVTVSWS
jgi:septation ring formation regulator EzrA